MRFWVSFTHRESWRLNDSSSVQLYEAVWRHCDCAANSMCSFPIVAPVFRGGPQPTAVQYQCLWDTGTTITAVTKRVATDLALPIEARILIQHAGGASNGVPQHYVNLQLPNGLVIVGRAVAQLPLANCDVLVGMDTISLGDFAISNFDGRTTFTFRIPSVEELDFVAESD